MLTKITLLASLFLSSTTFASSNPIQCTRTGDTRSFKINLDAYEDNEHKYAVVDVIQYPGITKRFYRVESETLANGSQKITMFNPDIYFQADQKIILRINNTGKTTLETFWIRGCSGFEFCDGASGSTFYKCK